MAKVSVITGGAGGIGIEIAKLLAKDTDILIADIQASRIEIAKDELKDFHNIVYMLADVSKIEDVQALAAKVQEMGELQNVIHAAGISEVFAGERVLGSHCMTNNVNAAIHMGNVFIPMLTKGCNYINIASMTSYYQDLNDYIEQFKEALKGNLEPLIANCGDVNTTVAYNLSKAFVRWYTMANIDRVGERGARINSISPGIIWTPMPQGVEALMPGVITGFAASCPMEGRTGEAKEVADLVEFLCRPGYINGTDILIDGGILHHVNIEQLYD